MVQPLWHIARLWPFGYKRVLVLEDDTMMQKLLAKLDLETQQAVIHYYVDEMTLEEVAAAIGRSVPTVRKRLGSVVALPSAS